MYTALYRSYRPRNFFEVFGQEHITTTLKNQIINNKLSHAYLFTGSHGTGKTSCAKLLAKAVNCLNNDLGEPCNQCDVCKGLDNGNIYDVIEIDAASNNGVDYIRELREQINYVPSVAKYRVYIIDEVHMLSIGAFNALLKTLEEPPSHVIFMLITTETHKIPATIMSRCQWFDFMRISSTDIVKRVQDVCVAEGVSITEDAAFLIARLSDGALRDALSILDQCMAKMSIIDTDLVQEISGMISTDYLFNIADSIYEKQLAVALEQLAELHRNSKDSVIIVTELIRFFRNILVYNITKSILDCTKTEEEIYIKLSKKFNQAQISHILEVLEIAYLAMGKTGTTDKLKMEMAFIKLCTNSFDNTSDFSSINSRIEQLEKKLITANYLAQPQAVQVKQAIQPTHNNQAPNKILVVEPVDLPIANPAVKSTIDEPLFASPPILLSVEADFEELITLPAEPASTELDYEVTDIPPEFDYVEPAEPPVYEEYEVPTDIKEQLEPNDIKLNDGLFTNWADVMAIIKTENRLMYAVLNQSRAYIDGAYLLIDVKNDQFKELMKNPRHKDSIKNAVFTITGNKYNLGPYNDNKQPNITEFTENKLDTFEAKLKSFNVPEGRD